MRRQADSAASGLTRVLVVDDHAVVRRGLVELIRTEPGLVVGAQAKGPDEALAMARRERFDLAIVDLSYNEISGIELIKSLREVAPQTRVLVLSMLDESYYAERCIRAGAMGFVMKQAEPESLLEAVRQIQRGQVYLSPEMKTRLLRTTLRGGEDQPPELLDALTDRELEVFELLGRGLSPHEIAKRLHRSVKTVQTHRGRVREKLRLSSNDDVVQHAIRWFETGGRDGATDPG